MKRINPPGIYPINLNFGYFPINIFAQKSFMNKNKLYFLKNSSSVNEYILKTLKIKKKKITIQ